MRGLNLARKANDGPRKSGSEKIDGLENYVVVDIENPNNRQNSICSIAILIIENEIETKSIYSLINPEDRFEESATQINKIRESDVLGQPTLEEFWPSIRDLLTDNVIIGHNVRYDLSVLAKALYRYNIPVPTFSYIDTLSLAKENMPIDIIGSSKLSVLSQYLHYEYDPHNAYSDAKATLNLFRYIISSFDIKIAPVQYKADLTPKKKLNESLISHINELCGIIKGINYDGQINDREIELLNQWIANNNKHRQYEDINSIITSLECTLKNKEIDEHARIELSSLVKNITTSKRYGESTLAIQELNGIIKGISGDNEITMPELEGLHRWLEGNDYLEGVYPYDAIYAIANQVMQDGVISAAEREKLNKLTNALISPTNGGNLRIEDISAKTFCLTGSFSTGEKSDIAEMLKRRGCVEKQGVSRNLDLLIVGGQGSDMWKYGDSGGKKISDARELIEKGGNIKIISEADLIQLLNNEREK